MTDNVPIAYTDAGGTARPLAAQQSGSLYSFQSVPTIDGVPVRAATPMPVTDAAAAANLATIAAQDTLSATAAGTQADAAYAGSGSTSMIGALKGLFSGIKGLLTFQLVDAGGTNKAAISPAGVLSTADAANGPATPGTAASFSELAGGRFNTTLPTLTNGQQAAIQLDASGRQIVNIGAGSLTTAPANSAGAFSGATVTASAALLLAANTAKVVLRIYNLSTSATLYLNFGGTAAVGAAGNVPVTPLGAFIADPAFVPSDAISAISSAGSIPVTIEAK